MTSKRPSSAYTVPSVPRSSISPRSNAGRPLASKVPKIMSIPDGISKITSAVSGIVRASFTANRPPWADSDAGAVSPTIQRSTSV